MTSVLTSLAEHATRADRAVTETMLKKQYEDNPNCQWAARIAVGTAGVDLLDGKDNAGDTGTKAQSWLDLGADVAMMRCVGMDVPQIVGFFVVEAVVAILVLVRVFKMIPDGFVTCTDGTDCGNVQFVIELVLAAVAASVVVAGVHWCFRSVLKLTIFEFGSLFVTEATRHVF